MKKSSTVKKSGAVKKLNTAQSLLANIALKTKLLPMFGGEFLVKQWKASEQVKYINLLQGVGAGACEIEQLLPQVQILAMSLVDDKGAPLFDFKWEGNNPVFSDADAIDTILENRAQEASEVFVEISKFNGVFYGDDKEEIAAKN